MKRESTPLQLIRKKCLDCSNGSIHEVRLCPQNDCPIYPLRFGYRLDENGERKKTRILSEEHKQKLNQGRRKKYQIESHNNL